MKTTNRIAMVLAAALGLGSTGLFAQNKLIVNVPFDFTVKATRMPAGEYEVNRNFSAPDQIQISSLKQGESVLVSTFRAHLNEPGTETPRLVFHRYGNRYFLSEVWTADGIESQAMPGKLEKEAQAMETHEHASPVDVAIAGTR